MVIDINTDFLKENSLDNACIARTRSSLHNLADLVFTMDIALLVNQAQAFKAYLLIGTNSHGLLDLDFFKNASNIPAIMPRIAPNNKISTFLGLSGAYGLFARETIVNADN